MAPPTKVTIIGSGNWGTAIAKIVGHNVRRRERFDNELRLFVYEEMVDGKKLSEIINETHENVKYLPGVRLPDNVVAVPDIRASVKDSDILVFVIPHQFVKNICGQLKGAVKSTAIGLSLIKGVDINETGLVLISSIIEDALAIPVSVLMGANLANEVAQEKFCETTIGCKDKDVGVMLKEMCQAPYFRVAVVDEVEAVELCGALKNVIAVAAGITDGLDQGDNTKAAVIRLGLMEMIKFIELFYPGCSTETFLESCGIADLVTTCYGGRNRRLGEAFVRTGKSFVQLERELMNGQKLQGPTTAAEVYEMLKNKGMEDQFPLFTAIHRISSEGMPAKELIKCLMHHPEHMDKEYHEHPFLHLRSVPATSPTSP
ncbi:PREDICTED: glycerol-3-phosphate dehydrogenase [NAD(+)], cytoplasmic-like isoform X1 [Priapulus caudatus]|uniref:Glycerol-3-phosphate dehydrogenase [NAD(+)] n=1 Tax=Priapulus caudatus TaxID=37621 RepID=A0ABM1EBU2_PRICU|nr:PREDICTED: glycerol-3-phosphate dehydrogenase [NAD(+)], cytoplasmic-like isoform X1 [Priapulus caudatus]